MAWLRVLIAMMLAGRVAAAHPQPPPDWDVDPLHDREVVGRMRPPPPVDPNEIFALELNTALARATTDVQACMRRLRLAQIDVRVVVGSRAPFIQVPRMQPSAALCVKRVIAESIRVTFGPGFKRQPALETTFRYLRRTPRADKAFAQPPPSCEWSRSGCT
jgi:hypothetical protein